MKTKVKMLAMVLALVMLVAIVPSAAQEVRESKEFGIINTPLSAGETELVLSEQDEADKNYISEPYTFSLIQSGRLILTFECGIIDNWRSLHTFEISIYDAETEDLITIIKHRGDQGNSDGTAIVSTPAIPVEAGDYYTQVKLTSSPAGTIKPVSYWVKVNFTGHTSDYEVEPNNNIATATLLPLDTDIIGNIHREGDEDFYKIILTAPGRVTLNFTRANLNNTRDLWRLTLQDDGGNPIWTKLMPGNQGSIPVGERTNLYLDKGTYYIRVNGGTGTQWSGEDYTLIANFTKSDGQWQQRPNDTRALATPIETDNEITANLLTLDDVCWFTFTLTETKNVSLTFANPNVESTGNIWKFTLFNNEDFNMLEENIKGNIPIRTTDTKALPAGTYFARVQAGNISGNNFNALAAGVDFKITLNTESVDFCPICGSHETCFCVQDVCQNCGNDVIGDFCSSCGTKVGDNAPTKCENCKANVLGDYCGKCGTKAGDKKPPVGNGDCNCTYKMLSPDGKVSMADALQILRSLVKLPNKIDGTSS